MALNEVVKTLISVKADTSQAKAEFKSLRGVERQAAKDRLDELERQNRGIDDQIGRWTKVGVAIGGVTAAYVVAQRAAKAYLEDVRLESAAAGANVAGLQRATLGLVEADNLLAFAGKAMHGTWKLNQEEMEKVLRGATALRKTMGVELQPTIDALTDSIAKGNTRALKEFGIEAKDKQGVLRELDDLYKRMGGNVGIAGDNIAKSGVQVADAFDDIQGQLGKMVVELQPAIEAMAEFLTLIAGAVGRLNDFTDALVGVDTAKGQSVAKNSRKQAEELRQRALLLEGQPFGGDAEAKNLRRQADDLDTFATRWAVGKANKAFDQLAKTALDESDALKRAEIDKGVVRANKAFDILAKEALRKAGTVRGGRGGGRGDVAGDPLGWDFDFGAAAGGVGSGLGAGFGAWNDQRLAGQQVAAWEAGEFARQAAARRGGGTTAAETFPNIEKVIGASMDFNAQAAAVDTLAMSFQGLEGAVTSAYAAWVTGSESIGSAFKKGIGQALMTIGAEMQVNALKEAALSLASLAMGNYPGAGAHAAAAAGFQAAAIAAGLAARQMGVGGGGGGGSAARRAPTVTGRSSGGGPVTRNVTIVMGPGTDDMTERERSARLARVVRRGTMANQSTTSWDA